MSYETHQKVLNDVNQFMEEHNPHVRTSKWREHYHFMMPTGWINDPCGLVCADGTYHMFCQHQPYKGTWGQMFWGHSTSRDMIHWEKPEEGIAPSEDYDGWTGGGIFTGSAIYEDSEINAAQPIVDDEISKMADIRKSNGGKPILHASVSAKYTMRSDRAQNSRTEALNLIRNRKGHLPHIVVVTAEPMPNRLASLALGTGDIDCVYHFALYELIRAVKEAGSEDAVETLETLVQGKRLKDISDLPLDLSV